MIRIAIVLVVLAACGRVGFETRSGVDPDADPPCSDCAWHVGTYLPCSESCTTGTERRDVACVDGTGAPVADGRCAGERPSDARACTVTSCAWNLGPFGACTVKCGGGAAVRTVACFTNAGVTAPDGYCAGTRPADSQVCNAQACCADLGNVTTELQPPGPPVCGSPTLERYMVNPDAASMAQRCTELGYESYGNFNVPFTFMEWCYFCNARTKQFTGGAWVINGCNVGITTLRCCNSP